MKKNPFKAFQLALLLVLTAAVVSGCIWWGPEGRGRGRRGYEGGSVTIEGGHDHDDHDDRR